MAKFELVSKYQPSGDQEKAIHQLVQGVEEGSHEQILLGATGTGKTFTMANVIAQVNQPTLVIAHNKTLAGQLYNELKEFFPHNAVEYFVSYYDYYQPESYNPISDTYIEKDASRNADIDRLRHSATNALLEREDVIIVSSVSAIYGLGNPEEYKKRVLSLRVGSEWDRQELLHAFVERHYERNDINFQRGTFRVRGDLVEIIPANYENKGVRLEFFGDELEGIYLFDVLTGHVEKSLKHIAIFPATHFLSDEERLQNAIAGIEKELEERLEFFEKEGKPLEKERLQQRTEYDLEMLKEMGYTSGIENYARYFDGRKEGNPPFTLLDFFPDQFLTFIDESHATVPQLSGMVKGDLSRKNRLAEYGFRLPSAAENRPLSLEEFEKKVPEVIYISATPGDYELGKTDKIVEQIIRPTGLLDPKIEVRPTKGQMEDLLGEIRQRVKKKERVFVTTLTKKMAEDLTDYLRELDVRVRYMHSDIKTLERSRLLRDLRLGKFDVLVGINLLREGIDVPEVSLVAIMDADKEGFLRNERSLIQTIGRAARNAHGEVIMYADKITPSMKKAIYETERRRSIQEAYNKEHGITPKTIIKEIPEEITIEQKKEKEEVLDLSVMTIREKKSYAQHIEQEMKKAAEQLDFEQAAELRDLLKEVQKEIGNK